MMVSRSRYDVSVRTCAVVGLIIPCVWAHRSRTATYDKSSAVAEMGYRLVTIDMGRKVGGCCAPFVWGGGSWSPSITMWPAPRPIFIPTWHLDPSNRLARVYKACGGFYRVFGLAVEYTNVTDRQTTVRWHRANRFTNGHPKIRKG